MKKRETVYKVINKNHKRIDGYEKVTGRLVFGADQNMYNQLYARTVYSSYPHAEILNIDTSKAEAVPGFICSVTAADVPGSNSMFGRFPVLAGKKVKYIGDGVVVVAAETEQAAEEAASCVSIEYRELPALLSVEEALAEDAPRIHADADGNMIDFAHHKMRLGDVEKGFKEADFILEQKYSTGFAYNGYIEPEAVIVYPDPSRQGIVIQGTIQNPYNIRECVAEALAVRMNQVRVIQSAIGGSFGGKDESMIVMSARCALVALKTRRPVKMVLTREQSFLESANRHPYYSHYKLGAGKDGTIFALEDCIYAQGGPYNKQAMFVNWRGSVHAAGPYRIPHVKTDIYGVYTNTVFGGAYRGFSAPQIVFAVESLIDELAEICGKNPLEIRLKNCLAEGDQLPTGQYLTRDKMPANLHEMLVAVAEKTDFANKWEKYRSVPHQTGNILNGIGLSCTFRGAGLGGEGLDTGAAVLTLDRDGFLNMQSSSTELGQGIRTTHAQIAGEVLGMTMDKITFSATDTSITLDAGPTVASRGILAGGNAVKIAAEKLKKRLSGVAAELLNCGEDDLEFADNTVWDAAAVSDAEQHSLSITELAGECHRNRGIPLTAQGWFTPKPEHLDHHTGRGNAYPSYLFGVAVSEVLVDTGTGKITVKKITAAYELGRAINPEIVRGQLIGGLMQGLGYAIMEELDTRDGMLRTHNFDDYMMPGVMDMPEIDIILFESDDNVGPFGAKGIGEIGIELIAPSIANAFTNATGKRIRELPLNFERVLLGKALR